MYEYFKFYLYYLQDLSGPSLVSVDTNSHTGQLLALASDGTVHSISVNKQGDTMLQCVCDLCTLILPYNCAIGKTLVPRK